MSEDDAASSTITQHHEYTYASGKLLREVITTTADGTSTTQTLDFFYDSNGTPYAISVDGTVYYYITNLQGDVMSVVDGSGTVVASYEYDPYGAIISATGDLAEINPLRYRGYYYDQDTRMYYLQSRYYDPATCRFINADAYASTGQGFIGFNMFAYCGNNPICLCDTAGTFAQFFYEKDYGVGSSPYINDQEAEPFASMQLGEYTVSYAGCGAVAAYNAHISLGAYVPFSDVLAYFNGASNRTFANGKFGILPWQVGSYFESLGYNIAYAYTKADIDNYSNSSDACIMFYMFPRRDTVFGITGTWPGAHFVEYTQVGDSFRGHNTGGLTGVTEFRSPSEFGYNGSNFYAIGIFIYK